MIGCHRRRHSVSGADGALGSGCAVCAAYLRLQLHRAWRLASLRSGTTGGGGGRGGWRGGGGGGGGITPWPLQTDSSITLCSITFLSFFYPPSLSPPHTKPSGKKDGSAAAVSTPVETSRQGKTPAVACLASLTVCHLSPHPPPTTTWLFITGPAHDVAWRRRTVRSRGAWKPV